MGFKGYHSKIHRQLITIERTRTNAFGVYEEIIATEHNSKLVTFFPDNWNEETIQKKAEEAYSPENRISMHDRGFVGKTNEGILIAFWFNLNNATNQYEVTFYPLLETAMSKP